MPAQSMSTEEYKCNQCGKVMQSKNELQEHQKTHKSKQQTSGTGPTSQAGGGHSGG